MAGGKKREQHDMRDIWMVVFVPRARVYVAGPFSCRWFAAEPTSRAGLALSIHLRAARCYPFSARLLSQKRLLESRWERADQTARRRKKETGRVAWLLTSSEARAFSVFQWNNSRALECARPTAAWLSIILSCVFSIALFLSRFHSLTPFFSFRPDNCSRPSHRASPFWLTYIISNM